MLLNNLLGVLSVALPEGVWRGLFMNYGLAVHIESSLLRERQISAEAVHDLLLPAPQSVAATQANHRLTHPQP